MNLNNINIKVSKEQREWINKAEDFADSVLFIFFILFSYTIRQFYMLFFFFFNLFSPQALKYTKNYLPTIARLCLVSTFLEDGIRMWSQWKEQSDYIAYSWGASRFIGTLFVLTNFFGQLVPCSFILIRKHVNLAVYFLFGIIALQVMARLITNYISPRSF